MNIPFGKISRHISHYLPLIGILTATVLGFYLFPYDKAFQLAVSIAGASGYVSWGLIHHYIHKDLNLTVILEYFAMACLGVVILFFVLFRS